MNMKKIIAGSVASVMAVTSLATFASADVSFPYTATLGFADGSWAAQDWESTVEITGDGTYTLKANCLWDDEETGDKIPAEITGIMVFVVDIAGLGTDLGVSQEEDYDMSKCTISDVKVTVDGSDIAVDQSKILYGDPEDKGNLRLEVYNAYGSTCTDQAYDPAKSPVNPADINAATELSVTFTLSLAGGAASDQNQAPAADENQAPAADTQAPTAGNTDDKNAPVDKNNADTGVEGVAAVAGIAIIAAGAIVIAKKRK